MIGFWKFLGAWWSDDATTAGLPAEGAEGTYVATLDTTTREVAWALATGGADEDETCLLVDTTTGEFISESGSGDLLFEVCGSGGSEAGGDADSIQYVATTGSDITGDGTSGTPYLTVAKAVSRLPSDLGGATYEIEVADGTYAEAVDVSGIVNGTIKIIGDTTTPANVTFTGTTGKTQNNDSGDTDTATVYVAGDVVLELEGVRVNATADYGVWVNHGAHVILDRSTVTGTLVRGVQAEHGSLIEFRGNVTVSGWTTRGIGAFWRSRLAYTSAGTLTVTGPGTTGQGINISNSSWLMFSSGPSGLNITITGVEFGFALSFNASFTHQGPSATITIDNASKPAASAAVRCTDMSTWSTPNTTVFDNFTDGVLLNSICYLEATGTRTWTNLTNTSTTSQNSVAYLP
jgi:hypothetical protein